MNKHENEFNSLLCIDKPFVINSCELKTNTDNNFYILTWGYTFTISALDNKTYYSCVVDIIRNNIRLDLNTILDNEEEIDNIIYRSIPFNVDCESYFQYCLSIKGYIPQYDTVLKIQDYIKKCLKLLNNTCNMYDIGEYRKIYEIKHYPVTGIF